MRNHSTGYIEFGLQTADLIPVRYLYHLRRVFTLAVYIRSTVVLALSLSACRFDYDPISGDAGVARATGDHGGPGARDAGNGAMSGGGGSSGGSAEAGPTGDAGDAGSGGVTGGAGRAAAAGGTAGAAGAATMGGAAGSSMPPTGFHASIAHRYTFDGADDVITDSVGSAHGTAIHAAVANGAIDLLAQSSDAYIELPSGLLDGLGEVTFEAWLQWHGSARYERIVDFGSSTSTDVMTFLVLSPSNRNSHFGSAANFTATGGDTANNWETEDTSALRTDIVEHVAVTYDGTAMELFRNGALVERSADISLPLSAIDDTNDWLGRSQFTANPRLDATLYEFRIYASALTANEIQASFDAGQNP